MMKSSFAYICWSRTANLPRIERIGDAASKAHDLERRDHISKCLHRIDLWNYVHNDNPVSNSIPTQLPFDLLRLDFLIRYQIIMAPIQFSSTYLLLLPHELAKKAMVFCPKKCVLVLLVKYVNSFFSVWKALNIVWQPKSILNESNHLRHDDSAYKNKWIEFLVKKKIVCRSISLCDCVARESHMA